MGKENRGDLAYLTDGTGVMVFGSEQELAVLEDRFDGGIEKLSPQILFRAYNALTAVAEVKANPGKWVKLDAESAKYLKAKNIKHPVSGVIRKGEAGDAGNAGEILKLLKFEAGGISPALATGAAGIAAQAAIEAAVDEILEYLEVIDEKLDTLLRQRKVEAVSGLGGIQYALEEADALYRESNSVSRTTWSKIQHLGSELKVMEALAVEQLADAASQLQASDESKKTAALLKSLADDIPFWLGVLARSIYLQDRAYVLELAHVNEFEPDQLNAHRQGIVHARSSRITATSERLLGIDDAVRDSATLSNQVWVSNPLRARQITSRANGIHEEIVHFARHVETDLEAGSSLETRRWKDSVRSLAGETIQAATRVREQMRTRSEDRTLAKAAEIEAARKEKQDSTDAGLVPMTQTYTWEHWDDPNIKNVAEVAFTDDGLTATGTQHGNGYHATWTLDAAEEWITRRVTVEVQGDGWARTLKLTRNDDGKWSSDTTLTGEQPADLPSPGIADGVELNDALDCDLGLCPMTNTMPIRRLNLLTESVPDTQLIVAWIDMPSLQIIASDQYYGSIDQDTVHYRSGTRGVDVELEVDHDGVVIAYPDMARRI